MYRKSFCEIISILMVFVLCFCVMCKYVKIEANQLKEKMYLQGKTVFIDAGHGGKDDGASVNNVLEDSINMKIGGYLLEELMNSGAYVLMSRTGDYDLASMYDVNRKRKDLYNRVKYINESDPDVFISIHLNTYSSENVSGAQVFYQKNNNSLLLAGFLQHEMNELSGRERKSKIGDYYILNNSNSVGVIIECGFLSNTEEREKLSTDTYQRKISTSIKKGLINYFIHK